MKFLIGAPGLGAELPEELPLAPSPLNSQTLQEHFTNIILKYASCSSVVA
jgi:hypothetical protein